jgi:hypothetical protein
VKRPAGLVASAVVLTLISLFQVFCALGMALVAITVPRQTNLAYAQPNTSVPSWITGFMFGLCIFFLALAAWGIATAIGVIRLRRWARYSILVIGGLIAVFSSLNALFLLAMMAMPLPIPDTAGAAAGSTALIAKAMFGVMALVYVAGAAIGIWWLVYFNLKSVLAVFAGQSGEWIESPRPLLVSIYAVCCIFGALICLLAPFLPFPAIIFGAEIQGSGKFAFYFAMAAIDLAIGIGTWQLAEWARRLALAFLVFGALHMSVYLVRPSLWLHNMEAINSAMNLPQPTAVPMQNGIFVVTSCFSLLFMAAIAYMLHYYRTRFRRPAAPQLAPPALPS